MKNTIVFALVFALVLTYSTTVFADITISSDQNSSINLVCLGHGQYSITTSASNRAISYMANNTAMDGLYQLADKSYVYETNDGIFLAVDKIDIHVNNQTAEIASAAAKYNLPKDVLNALSKRLNILSQSKDALDSNAVVSLIAPKVTSTASSSTYYYTYGGYNMYDYAVYTPSASTGYFTVSSNIGTQTAASAIFNIVIIGGGVANATIGLFAAGWSAFDTFLDWANRNTIQGNTNDFLQCKITYENWDKLTYYEIGNTWYLGCVSQRVYVREVKTLQHYVNAPNPEYEVISNPYYTRKSESFSNPGARILANLFTPWSDDLLTAKYYNKTVIF